MLRKNNSKKFLLGVFSLARRYENPKRALMAVVKILLNGGDKDDLQEDLDKYYEILGRQEFVVDR